MKLSLAKQHLWQARIQASINNNVALLSARSIAEAKSKSIQSEALTKHDMLELFSSSEFTANVQKAMEKIVIVKV